MGVFKKTLLLLFLVSSVACSRNQRDSSVVNNTSEENSVQPQESESIQEIDSNSVANDSVAGSANTAESQAENQDSRIETQVADNWHKPYNAGYNWWMIGALVSLLFNLLLAWLLYKTINDNHKLEERKKHYKNENKSLKTQVSQLRADKNAIFEDYQKLKNRKTLRQNASRDETKEAEQTNYDDEKPVEVSLSLNNSSGNVLATPEKQPVNLYAGKATEDNTFTSVSEQEDEYKSIFKLTLEDQQAETAQFEVLNSDYILKMAVNSPDTYLYTVCKPENSNQNFSEEVATLKKGIAHKINGKWQVKDENKATIKFQ